MDRASGSSSSSCFRWTFDVFLSFRGEDTRSNFTSHLNMALRQRGINVFIDNRISRGQEISASLFEAIEESKISIVIISQNYASSSWCLNELVKIIMCKELRGQVVLPIFYKVNPSQVRKQNGAFGEAFAELEVRFFDKMQAWGEALTAVSHMSGWVVLEKDDEANLIQKIVQQVWKKLTCSTMQLPVTKYPVGIDRQFENLLSHVMIDGTRMVGLHGIGGMGKTTLAKTLYNRIADDFEGCCFLANIREASKQHEGLVRLQEKLLYEILMDDFIRVSDLYKGINIIRNRLCSKKILLILDDIDTSEQLQVLAGGYDWFGYGSKVIVTTRNEHLLDIHGFNKLRSVPELNYGEALELFSWHAFQCSSPPTEYLQLSKDAVNYCKNLPLALEVLGSFLYSTDQSKFKGILEEFAISNLDKDIQNLLQVSYDELEGDVQEMFLFISCFFVGEDKTMVETMLKSCGCLCWEKGIQKLMNLSLLTINQWNKVEMHDLIQQLGHTIARSKTSISPSEKKLLVGDDAMHVLDGIKDARAVKAIKLEFPKPTKLDIIDSTAFRKVKNLVVLKVKNVISPKISTLDFLPNSLRWMSWSEFPFSSFPSSYSMENLIQLKLPHSAIQHFGRAFMEHVDGHFKQLILMNCDIPDWFSYKSRNNHITIFMPSNDPSWEMKVFAPCVKFQVNHVDRNRYMDLECKMFINDIQVWSSEEVPCLEESRRILIEESPYEYMWLLVLYPHIDFPLNSEDIVKRSQEYFNLHQPSFGINSMGRDNNNCNVDDDRRNHFGESIWRKFTVSFGVNSKFKDSQVSIKRCGVHVIMEEWRD
ncbi:TMV resistance protein N isoform X2 [Cucumis sativus]|uniref:TMV resistance protein N isoform X2 n=1 Tax=Cucumis sativus TaxID=3659 RepID=UPI0005ECF203|nr:TMV resistance protein N isoform X2 [Cucumis sativus]